MNTGQMMITISALVLLGLVIMRVNNGFLSTNMVMMESKFGVLAVSLATSTMEDAVGKAFDENTDTTATDDLSDLSTCGPDGEIYPFFDDFDDFNGLVKYDTIPGIAIFKTECEVGYIHPGNPDSIISTKTWHKIINVQVTNSNMSEAGDTVSVSSIYSYFYFR